jgi:hypothetical protein
VKQLKYQKNKITQANLAYNIKKMKMPKKTKNKIKSRKLEGLGGLLAVIIVLFILSYVSALNLFVSRLIVILSSSGLASPGIYITSLISLLYVIFLVLSILLIFKKKRFARNISIITLLVSMVFSFWYNLLGKIIFYTAGDKAEVLVSGASLFILDTIIILAVILYFLKSERVKNTLVK